MPKQTPYPSGPIAVEEARLKDLSVGMDWNMPDASDVRFLAVSGTLWVGASRTTYDFTLVEYHLHIDEVSWTIFSTLNNAMEQEFTPEFWDMVNPSRKERWGFREIPWDGKAYEVAPPYTQIRLSIFNDFAHTMRIVRPFVWNDSYLKVHPNGAAVFAEHKKLAFLLPLIVEAHALLPPTPLFWTNDDQTIPLLRTTLWLHERTIQWLSETGETYPPELRNEIQPRLDKLKPSQPAKKLQPPTPPKPTRWQEKPKETQIMQAPQEPVPHDPKGTQTSPQQVADHERQYMELQATFARMRQRTIAESRPTNSTQSQASASLPSSNPPATGETNTTLPSNSSTNAATEAPVQQGSHRPPKVSAHSLADQRPAPPSPPTTHEPKLDTPGTGELSTHSPHPSVQIGAKQQPFLKHEQPTFNKFSPAERSTPVDSPTESSGTLATDTVVVSSPEPACEPVREADLFAADIPTLRNWQRVASENVEALTTRLARARDNLCRITKRLKTMQDGQEPDASPASPTVDIEIDLMD